MLKFDGWQRGSTAAAILCFAASSLGGCNSSGSTPAAAATVPSMTQLLRQKVKHVFVLIQENHSFDNYFGLYPGTGGQAVENLASATAQQDDCVPDPQTGGCQQPFLISANPNSPSYVPDAPDIDGGNNDRNDQDAAIDHEKMDGWLADAEGPSPSPLPANPTAAQIEAHNDAISIEAEFDCDTIPYIWYYAKNFALFDHYFQANTGQSTPGNIQLFSGQIGQTEAAAEKAPIAVPVAGGGYSDGVPISNDDNPPPPALSFIPPYGSPDAAQSQSYATMPVLLNPGMDRVAVTSGVLGKIPDDISLESRTSRFSIPWAWYEEGLYTPNAGLSAHHTAPLYFDYINGLNSAYASTTTLRDNTLSNGLISDIQAGKLPSTGVFWVKGGKKNQYGFTAADPNLATVYTGDDDHPGSGNSDHQVAEAYLASVINAIAGSKYWKDSVIIVTWDDDGGMYDHYPPPQNGPTCPQDETGPEAGYPCGDGVRLPLLIVSPFAKTGTVVHDQSDGGSVSKFIETVFNLPTFASLPDEAAGVAAGLAPADAEDNTSNLMDAIDPAKLAGNGNPASLAEIPAPAVPPSMSCASLGITPIAAPTSLPVGFETAGYYISQAAAAGASRRTTVRPPPRDGGD
jgi:phospholipase C